MFKFGYRLRELRINSGLTQSHVAEFLRITLRNYQYYEASDVSPEIDTLVDLAQFYDVSLDYLVGLSDSTDHMRNHVLEKLPPQKSMSEKAKELIRKPVRPPDKIVK